MHEAQVPPPLEPDAPARPRLHALQLRQLPWGAPRQWLWRGWQDWRRCPCLGLFYGACYVATGWLVLTLLSHAPAVYALAALPLFLLLGPLLMLGSYYASMRLERGLRPDLGRSLHAWGIHPRPLGWLALLFLGVSLLWLGVSLGVFSLFLGEAQEINAPLIGLLTAQNHAFVLAYLLTVGCFAVTVFALGAVSIPLVLDRGTDPLEAVALSLNLVRSQPGVMLMWAGLIGLLVLLALLPAFLGLLLIGPLLGHASWHVYRDSVEDLAPVFVIDIEADPEDPSGDGGDDPFAAPCCTELVETQEVLVRVDTSHLNTI